MKTTRVVIDTNILYAALYSSSGASNALIIMVRDGLVIPCISVTLAMEYEDVLTRHRNVLHVTQSDIKAFLGFIVNHAERLKIHYLWRPCLKDSNDDMVLEVAVTAGVDFIVTHNTKDFEGSDHFGIRAVTPGWFLKNFGGIK
jgi:putative PIN family toxin of toxin-antitoxin system